MKFNFPFRFGVYLFFLSVLCTACKREFKRPSLENELLTPILSTKLTINEIVPDSIKKVGSDGSVSLVYRNILYSSALESFQPLETREFEKTAKLQSLVLSSKSAVRTVSLGQVAEESGLSALIVHGSNAPIPPIPNLSYGPLAMDGTAFFETVTLDSGYMDVTIQNQFPTGLSNIDFEIINEVGGQLVGSESFTNVAAGQTKTQTIDLAGKLVEGQLLGNITNFDVDGTGGSSVPIDTTDLIIVTITVRDMKVNAATAIFPAQEVINLKDTTAMENVQDLRITKATAKTGYVDLRVVSTIDDTMYFHYFIPEGKKDGKPLELFEKIPPSGGQSIEKSFALNVDGYTFDLTGSPVINAYNAFYSEVTGRIDSTGKVVSLSLQDSLLVYVKLRDFVPEYVEGYLGSNTANIGPTAVPLELFRSFYGGSLEFEDVKLEIGVTNGNAVPFQVDLKSLQAQNTRTNQSMSIELASLPNPLEVDGASNLNSPFVKSWDLSDASSNVNKALNLFPNRMSVEMEVKSNPNQNINNLNQFAVDSNKLEAYADIEIPLSLIAEELIVADTVPFRSNAIKSLEGISSGTLYIVAQNAFPFESSLSIKFIDKQGNVLQEIIPTEKLKAGSRESSVESVIEWEFDYAALQRIFTAEDVIFHAEFNTIPSSQFQRIYSDQGLDVSISARFNYLFESK